MGEEFSIIGVAEVAKSERSDVWVAIRDEFGKGAGPNKRVSIATVAP